MLIKVNAIHFQIVLLETIRFRNRPQGLEEIYLKDKNIAMNANLKY